MDRTEDLAPINGPKRHLRSRWLFVLVLVALVVVVLLVLARWERGAPEPARQGPQPVAVQTTTVRGETLAERVRGIGTLRASNMVVVRPEIAGVVRTIGFVEGTAVKQGQVLFELDEETLVRQLASRRAALRAAEASLEDTKRTLDRQQQLWDRELIARAELDQARTDLELRHAEVDRLRAELAVVESQRRETRVRAPFAGVISERRVDIGAYVTSGQELATVYQMEPLELEFYLSERHLGQLRQGQEVVVTIAAYPDRPFRGRVDFVAPAVREATRDFLVKATIPNSDGLLKPGAFATALVTVDVREARPVVPEEALVATRLGYLVFIVEEGSARAREVRVGLRQDGMVEIVEGLQIGDRVVRSGHLRLSGGEPVREMEGGQP